MHSHMSVPAPVLVFALLMVVCPAHAVAESIPVPTTYWQVGFEPPATAPPNMVLVFPAELVDDYGMPIESALSFVDVTMTDASGAAVEGTLSYDGRINAVIWRPSALLTLHATYAVDWLFDNISMSALYGGWASRPNVSGSFDLTITEAAFGPVPEPTIEAASLVEVETPTEICCPGGKSLPAGDVCWLAHRYLPHLEVEFFVDVPQARLPYLYAVFTPGGAQRIESTQVFYDRWHEVEDPWNLCVRFEVVDLLLDATVSVELCVAELELQTVPHQAAQHTLDECVAINPELESSDVSSPSDTQPGHGTDVAALAADDGQVVGEDSCGCSLAGKRSGGSGGALLVVFLATVAAVRRRVGVAP